MRSTVIPSWCPLEASVKSIDKTNLSQSSGCLFLLSCRPRLLFGWEATTASFNPLPVLHCPALEKIRSSPACCTHPTTRLKSTRDAEIECRQWGRQWSSRRRRQLAGESKARAEGRLSTQSAGRWAVGSPGAVSASKPYAVTPSLVIPADSWSCSTVCVFFHLLLFSFFPLGCMLLLACVPVDFLRLAMVGRAPSGSLFPSSWDGRCHRSYYPQASDEVCVRWIEHQSLKMGSTKEMRDRIEWLQRKMVERHRMPTQGRRHC